MKVALLANHAISNAGDHAIMIETLRWLHSTWPDAQITLVFNDDGPARAAYPQHRVLASALAMALGYDASGAYQLHTRGARIALIGDLLRRTLLARAGGRPGRDARGQLVAALAEANIVLGCGGGYLRSDPDEIFGWYTLMALPFVLTHLLRRPLVLLPQSIGALPNIRQRALTSWIIKRAQLTVLRERISLAYLESLGLSAGAIVAPDMAFGMPQTAPMTRAEVCALAGLEEADAPLLIGVTAIDWAGQSYTFAAQSRYEAALLGAVDQLAAEGAQILFFTQSAGPATAEDDGRVAARILAQAAQRERMRLIAPLAPDRLQGAYGALDLLLGTRMHSVILATNAGTPAVALGYQPKTAGVLAEIGISQRGLEIANITADQIVATARATLAEPPNPRVAAYLDQARAFKAALAERLRRIAL